MTVKDYFEGWKEKESVRIPEVENGGFRENVIVRKPVTPLREKKPEEYNGEAPTVLLAPEVKIEAYVKRLSTGEEALVDRDGFVIGKSVEADYVVKNNPTVSRKHAKIHIRPDGYWLEDMGSSNHIFVQGQRITEAVKLTDGMRFTLSLDEEFEFSVRVGK